MVTCIFSVVSNSHAFYHLQFIFDTDGASGWLLVSSYSTVYIGDFHKKSNQDIAIALDVESTRLGDSALAFLADQHRHALLCCPTTSEARS